MMKPRFGAHIACALSLSLIPMLLPAPMMAAGIVQEGGTSSKIAGVAVPFRPAPVNNGALSGNFSKFLAEVAAEKKQTPGNGPAEVFFWSGDSYREGRSPAVRTAFKRNLMAAGYTVQEFEKSEMYANPFAEEIGLGAESGPGTINLSPWDVQDVIVATNPKTGRALVGVWYDQKHQKRLVLALAATGFVAPKKEGPLPALPSGALLVTDPHDTMKGQPNPPVPSFPAMSPKPGRVRGMVKDGSGRPLAGAKVLAEMSAAGGFRTGASGKTDANGVYDFVVPSGAGRVVMVGYKVSYNGSTYGLPLHPVDGECDDFSSARGHVEHFVLRSYGVADPDQAQKTPKYGGYYYGGWLNVYWLVDHIPQGGIMEITLTPKGPLIDGSKGRVIVYRIRNDRHGGDLDLVNIPIGRYELTARLLEDGEAIPVQISLRKGAASYGDSLTIDFEPKSADAVFAKTGGIERFDVMFKL
jgi:hypothetical protein